MKVKVATACSRCGRQEEREVTLEEAQLLQEKSSSTETFVAALNDLLEQHLENLEEGDIPEIIVLLRDENKNNYKIRALDDLCHRPDAKKMQGCRTRVQNLMSDLFMDTPTNGTATKKKQKKSTKKETAEQTPAQA